MSAEEKIKIGILGAGHIAQIAHIPQWSKIPNATVVAICDRVKNKARWVAERYNVPRYYSDPDEMFKSEDIDAIDICTETDTHKDLTISALSARKHVLVEKPMARTYEEARAMADAAKKYKRRLMVAMNVRFRREAITLKSFLDRRELGDVFYARSGWLIRRDLSNAARSWLYNKSRSGGGVLMDLGIQMLDVAWWLLGNARPVMVKAVTFNRSANLDVEDSATCLIHFENGSALALEVSWTILSEREYLYANVHGTQGTALINPLRVYKIVHGELKNIIPERDESPTIRYKRSYNNELRHFLASLNQNMPLQASGEEIAERLRVLEALYRSAREGKEVPL